MTSPTAYQNTYPPPVHHRDMILWFFSAQMTNTCAIIMAHYWQWLPSWLCERRKQKIPDPQFCRTEQRTVVQSLSVNVSTSSKRPSACGRLCLSDTPCSGWTEQRTLPSLEVFFTHNVAFGGFLTFINDILQVLFSMVLDLSSKLFVQGLSLCV